MKLAELLGADWLALTIGADVMPLTSVGGLTIRHGRTRVDEQPPASTLTAVLDLASLPRIPVVGDQVAVELTDTALAALGLAAPFDDVARFRFVGDVTDSTVAPGRQGLATSTGRLTVTAVSRRANLGRVDVGEADWPQELSGDRVDRILAAAAAAAGLTVGIVDVGTVQVNPRPAAIAKALELLEALSNDVVGVLVQRRDGVVDWHARDHRTNAAVTASLSAANVLDTVQWRQGLSSLVNTAVIGYGAASPQAAVTADDPVSIARYGLMPAARSTQLAVEAEAQEIVDNLVGRRSTPRWRIEALPLELFRAVDLATSASLLQLEVASLVAIVGFPDTGPYHSGRLFVEGWTESISQRSWRLELNVSDYALTGESPRWVDVQPTTRWVDVDPPDLTWQAAIGWATFADTVRWLDQPADRRWADVDPAATWATYTTNA